MKPPIILRVILTSAVLFEPLAAESIGLNLGAGRPGASLKETDRAGFIPQAHWNNLSGKSGGPITLHDDSAAETTAEVTWDTDEEWSVQEAAADPNGIFLKGYISENGGTDSTISIAGIPYDNYSLYVYVNHDRHFEDVVIGEANGAFPDFIAIENNTDVDDIPVQFFRQTISGEMPGATPGNYVVFPNLTSDSLELVLKAVNLVSVDGGTFDRNAISGIQIVNGNDSDGDGLLDRWETLHGLDPDDNGLDPNNHGVAGDPNNGANGDPDEDGVPNMREQLQKTDPNDADTDDDGLSDEVEDNGGTYISSTQTGTDPLDPDTDDDGLTDGWELANTLDPFDDGSVDIENGPAGNPDGDGLSNLAEQNRGTDPRDEDTDNDTLLDEVETNDGIYVNENATGTDPNDSDTDDDGLPDGVEDNGGVYISSTQTGTDPLDPDTDDDFLLDGVEDNGRALFDSNMTGTDPLDPDTDDDGLTDGWELVNMLDPFDDGSVDIENGPAGDQDGDGLSNLAEQNLGTDPGNEDTDDDTLLDGVETNDGIYVNENATGTDPNVFDSDGDGLSDGVEDNSGVFIDRTQTGTHPSTPDTDGDFLLDGVEDNGGVFIDHTQTGTDPHKYDTDGDGLRDGHEVAHGGDPVDKGDVILTDGAIAINFGSARPNAALDPRDLAGVFAQANWNNLAGSAGGPVALLDDFGIGSGAHVSWEMGEESSASGPAVGANGAMFTGWVALNSEVRRGTIDITDIPYDRYDLVLYFNKDPYRQVMFISEANAAFPRFAGLWNILDLSSPIIFDQQINEFDFKFQARDNGNFVIFPGLSNASLNLQLSADDSRGAITGLQIVNRGGSALDITDLEVDPISGDVTITWNSVAGLTYAVDAGADLVNWIELTGNVDATEGSTSYTDVGGADPPNLKRFYRVRISE